MSFFTRFQLWCLAFSILALPDFVLAQKQTWVGEIQSTSLLKPANLDAAPANRDDKRKLNKDARLPESPERTSEQSRSRAGVKNETKVNLGTRTETILVAQKKPLHSDDRLPSSVSKSIDDRAEVRWREIQTTLRPAKLIVLCEALENDLPGSQYETKIKAIAASARRAIEIQHLAGLSGDFFEDPVGDGSYRENLRNAVLGDKGAAYMIALAYKMGTSGVIASPRRMEQWLRFSAELGNGQASWELSKIYNKGGFVADAARFEQKALDLGYRPAPRLPTRGY